MINNGFLFPNNGEVREVQTSAGCSYQCLWSTYMVVNTVNADSVLERTSIQNM